MNKVKFRHAHQLIWSVLYLMISIRNPHVNGCVQTSELCCESWIVFTSGSFTDECWSPFLPQWNILIFNPWSIFLDRKTVPKGGLEFLFQRSDLTLKNNSIENIEGILHTWLNMDGPLRLQIVEGNSRWKFREKICYTFIRLHLITSSGDQLQVL